VSDLCFQGTVTAVEISPRAFRDLLTLSEKRLNLVPILCDAARPETYRAHVGSVDVLYQDVAQRDQGSIFLRNIEFLRSGGTGFLMIKSRSKDVAANPAVVYETIRGQLRGAGLEVIDLRPLEPFEADHAALAIRKP